MSRHHRTHYILEALLVVMATTILVLGLQGAFTANGRPSQPAPVSRTDELHAGLAAQATPVINCNPPVPAHLGACAPTQAYQGQNVAGDLLSDPFSGSAEGLLVPDISHYTGCPVNAVAMKRDGARAIIVALGDGPSYADPCARLNAQGAIAAGLPIGFYLFERPSPSNSPEAAADREVQLARAAGVGQMPLWADFEAGIGLGPSAMCSWETRLLARLESDTNRVAGAYTGAWWHDPNVGACTSASHSPRFGNRPLWVSGYALAPLIPIAWRGVTHNGRPYTLFQYTGDGLGPLYPHSLGGYRAIDISVYSGTSAQFATFTGGASPPSRTQVAQCGQLRYTRSHGRRGTPAEGDLRNALLANHIGCPDSKAVRTGPTPVPPQPSPDEFRMCRTLLDWRRNGRPASFRAQAVKDRNQLVRSRIRCNGAPPLTAVHY